MTAYCEIVWDFLSCEFLGKHSDRSCHKFFITLNNAARMHNLKNKLKIEEIFVGFISSSTFSNCAVTQSDFNIPFDKVSVGGVASIRHQRGFPTHSHSYLSELTCRNTKFLSLPFPCCAGEDQNVPHLEQPSGAIP